MRIALIAKPGHENTGVGRYTRQLAASLAALGHEVLVVHPAVPLPGVLLRAVKRLLGWDLAEFFNNYPLWVRYPKADIYHLTSQNLATLLLLHRPPLPTIVTVHDLIPYTTRGMKEISPSRHILDVLFDRLAVQGLHRATFLIAVTASTKASIIDNLGYPPGKIMVVHEGVG